jgi:hypothetical protein
MATKPAAKKAAPASSATSQKKEAPKKVESVSAPKAKTPAKKAAPASSATSQRVAETRDVSNTPKVRKSLFILIGVIILLGAAAYFARSLFVAAVVNGQPISRLEVVGQAEKQVGKQTLSNLVRNSLIEQEARSENVTVSDDEINGEIKKLEANLSKQGQKLDQVLEVQGMTRDDLRHLIRLDKLVSKMVGKDVKVSGKEVDDYIAKNKDLLPQDQDEKVLKQQVKDRLQQEKTTEKVKTWLEDLQKKANVIYFVQY